MTADEPVGANSQVRAEIDVLRAESRAREAELRDIAALLPAATSRRAVLSSMVRDLRTVPDRGSVLKRVVAKILRIPSDLVGWLRSR